MSNETKEKGRRWVTVAVDRETYDMLKTIGDEEGIMSISSVIKYLAKQYIKQHPELRLIHKDEKGA